MQHTSKIVLASGNPGKLREFQALFNGSGIELLAQSAFKVPSIEETGLSFVENALLKARNAALNTGLPALADDSGIEVDALRGAPGIYSARYAGNNAGDDANNRKLLTELAQTPDAERGARYQCVIVYLRHAYDPMPVICQGTWEGVIAHGYKGAGGFGYDPLFYLPEYGCTAAELTAEEKNRISHRGQATRALREWFLAHA
ncbi:MAG TPA: RdgB/HAM1 family non-canonical purine NTP pyrophosphatase [Gammaproteobacteria bacterium]|nr:RdgB/HAM1 family non-canonical purine NTP pyrophosphatase [Gammaproteobacteria bacterium]